MYMCRNTLQLFYHFYVEKYKNLEVGKTLHKKENIERL